MYQLIQKDVRGETCVPGLRNTFAQWAFSEPGGFNRYSRCLALDGWPTRKWSDEICSDGTLRSHICEYGKTLSRL